MVHSVSMKVEGFGLVKHTKSVKNNVSLCLSYKMI